MAIKQLLTDCSLKDEHGNDYDKALVTIDEAVLNTSIGIKAENMGDQYESLDPKSGGVYKAKFFGTQKAKAEGYPIRQLMTYIDGEFSDEIYIDGTNAEVQRFMTSALPEQDKIIAVVKADMAAKVG